MVTEDEIQEAQKTITAYLKSAQASIEMAKMTAERYNLRFTFEIQGDFPYNPDSSDWYSSSADC